ncbi:ARID DNA-binding domain-containing protein [Tanacetum coccineum]
MPSPNSHSSKWPKVHKSTYGLPNIWYQSKDWGPMRREHKLEFVQRQLKRINLKYPLTELLEKQGFDVGYDGNRCTLFPMFKDKKIHHFDEDKMRKMQNKYLQDYFESIANKDGMEQDTVRIKGNLYSTKVQTFNDFVIFLNLIKHDDIVSQEWDYFRNMFNKHVKWFFNPYLERFLPGSLPPIVNGVEIHLFDLYKLIENLGGYLSVHFSQEFDKVGEIMGLPKGNGEEIRRCYMNYLEILTSHLKTARAPLKAHTCAPLEPAWKAEIDREGLGTHQWKTGEHGANLTRSAVPKGKEVLEHLGVQLEDTTKYPSEPTQVHYMEKQQKFYTVPSSSKVKEEYASSTSSGVAFLVEYLMNGKGVVGLPMLEHSLFGGLTIVCAAACFYLSIRLSVFFAISCYRLGLL